MIFLLLIARWFLNHDDNLLTKRCQYSPLISFDSVNSDDLFCQQTWWQIWVSSGVNHRATFKLFPSRFKLRILLAFGPELVCISHKVFIRRAWPSQKKKSRGLTSSKGEVKSSTVFPQMKPTSFSVKKSSINLTRLDHRCSTFIQPTFLFNYID